MPETMTAVRHPHTGLRTPDDRLNVTSLKSLTTDRGVAFTATLRRDNKVVGTIENGGHGGDTHFCSKYLRSDPKALTDQQLTDYASQCRTEAGEPVDVEQLLNDLVEEFDCTRRIKKVEDKGGALLRLLGFIADGDGKPTGAPWAQNEAKWWMPASKLDLPQAAATLHRRMPPGENCWWQLWREGKWVDVTERPDFLPADLYC